MEKTYKISQVTETKGGTEITVDDQLSLNSLNPVQNKVITQALVGKQDKLSAGENISIVGNTINAIVKTDLPFIHMDEGTDVWAYDYGPYQSGTQFYGVGLGNMPKEMTEHTEVVMTLIKNNSTRYALMLFNTGIYEAHVGTYIAYHYADKFDRWKRIDDEVDANTLNAILQGSPDIIVDIAADGQHIEIHLDETYKQSLATKEELKTKQDELSVEQISNINNISTLETAVGQHTISIENIQKEKQNKLIAGANIVIEGDTISATNNGGESVTEERVNELIDNKHLQPKLTPGNGIHIDPENIITCTIEPGITSDQLNETLAAKNYQNAKQVDEAIIAKDYTTMPLVEAKGYQTASEVDTIITSKNYQSYNQVNSLITSKGYQTAGDVDNRINAKGFVDASGVNNIIEAKGYTNTSDVNQLIDNKNLQPKLNAGANISIQGSTISATNIPNIKFSTTLPPVSQLKKGDIVLVPAK